MEISQACVAVSPSITVAEFSMNNEFFFVDFHFSAPYNEPEEFNGFLVPMAFFYVRLESCPLELV